MKFTTSQLEAINTIDNNLLIIAGPPSPKPSTEFKNLHFDYDKFYHIGK